MEFSHCKLHLVFHITSHLDLLIDRYFYKKMEIENTNVTLHQSKSFYERLYDFASKSPGATISSVCALFITIILAVTIPTLLSGKFCNCNSS